MLRPPLAGHFRRCPTRLSAGRFPSFAAILRLISNPMLSLRSRVLRGRVTHAPCVPLFQKTLTRFTRSSFSAFYPVFVSGPAAGWTRQSAPRPRRPQAAERPGLPPRKGAPGSPLGKRPPCQPQVPMLQYYLLNQPHCGFSCGCCRTTRRNKANLP